MRARQRDGSIREGKRARETERSQWGKTESVRDGERDRQTDRQRERERWREGMRERQRQRERDGEEATGIERKTDGNVESE